MVRFSTCIDTKTSATEQKCEIIVRWPDSRPGGTATWPIVLTPGPPEHL